MIADSEIPRASAPQFQHILDTYASETNKVLSTWSSFAAADTEYRPDPKSSTVAGIMKHPLLSERRFFGELPVTPEPPASEVFPALPTPEQFSSRMLCLARPRL